MSHSVNEFNLENEKVFESVYDEYWSRLFHFALKFTGDSNLSEQIVQNVFVSIWERRKSLKIQSIENYLFKSVKYQIFNSFHEKNIQSELLEEHFEIYVEETSSHLDIDLDEVVMRAINELPEKRKRIFVMNKIDDMTPVQIATKLNLSPQTVKNQLSQAIKQLRLVLKKYAWLIILLYMCHFFC